MDNIVWYFAIAGLAILGLVFLVIFLKQIYAFVASLLFLSSIGCIGVGTLGLLDHKMENFDLNLEDHWCIVFIGVGSIILLYLVMNYFKTSIVTAIATGSVLGNQSESDDGRTDSNDSRT